MTAPRLVIVAGYPATGKTTLAREIAAHCHLPLVAKDDIKESLFDTLGIGDREWSNRLGRATYEVMFRLLRQFLSTGVDVVAEANFEPGASTFSFVALLEEIPVRPMLVVLHAEPDMIVERINERADTGERHPGHLDQDLAHELVEVVKEPYTGPELPGPRLDVDAAGCDIDAVVRWVADHWDDAAGTAAGAGAGTA